MKNTKEDLHGMFMQIALTVSNRSHAKRLKVGAVLVKDLRIISYGWNGMPTGHTNECETNNVTKPEVIHAEFNCIAKCAKSTESTEGSILYVTLSPCVECAKLIIQSGIKEVYYVEKYRDPSGIKLLKKSKIKCHEII